ncbi:hypothetical protein DY000_02034421 [Brassica cretica]|uniref:Uncharacterized protein n=1 Tax=Brassica cretica TaxID=69181 RepID=A0ABQ7DVQ1_BRACR|nr:hypothetical protein DY000_02034421 [Brassica cretica]
MKRVFLGSSKKEPADSRTIQKVEVLILRVDENGMLRDEEGRTRNSTGQSINAQGVVIPDLLDYIMAKRDEQHVSGELSRVEEAGTEDATSRSPDITTSTSTDDKTSTSIDMSTHKSTDVSSCVLVPDVDREITMEDFLELKDETTPENLDHNLEKKLDEHQHTSEKDLETSLEASIDRHQPDEVDRQPPHIIDLHPFDIDRHRQPLIDRHHPPNIDRCPLLDLPPGCIIEMEPIEERMYMSKASHLAVPKHQRPPIWTEEAAGLHKRMKRIHDPAKIVVPCAVIEVEFPIPPDKSVHLDSYSEILDDHQHVEASQRGLRFQDEVYKVPAEPVSVDTDRIPSIDTNKPASIDTTTSPSIDTTPSTSIGAITSPSIDTGRLSEQKEFDVCENIFNGDTTTRSDMSGGKKRRHWKKRKRIMGDSQLSLIPRFSDGKTSKEEELIYQKRSTTTSHCRSTEHHEYRSIAT